MNILINRFQTPLGEMQAAAVDEGICLLEFCIPDRLQKQMARVERLLGKRTAPGMNAHLEQLKSELDEYFSGKRETFAVALVTPGTLFQQSVWQALLHIPYGETRSYAQVAQALSRPRSSRAVGTANGANPISIVIPCHRLVNGSGGLSGYGGGLWRKQKLLELESGAHRPGAPMGRVV